MSIFVSVSPTTWGFIKYAMDLWGLRVGNKAERNKGKKEIVKRGREKEREAAIHQTGKSGNFGLQHVPAPFLGKQMPLAIGYNVK